MLHSQLSLFKPDQNTPENVSIYNMTFLTTVVENDYHVVERDPLTASLWKKLCHSVHILEILFE